MKGKNPFATKCLLARKRIFLLMGGGNRPEQNRHVEGEIGQSKTGARSAPGNSGIGVVTEELSQKVIFFNVKEENDFCFFLSNSVICISSCW